MNWALPGELGDLQVHTQADLRPGRTANGLRGRMAGTVDGKRGAGKTEILLVPNTVKEDRMQAKKESPRARLLLVNPAGSPVAASPLE